MNRPLCLDEFTEAIAANGVYKNNKYDFNTNKSRNLKMADVLMKAINGELTKKQRDCIICYYEKNMRIVDIAKQMNVCPSTISRHLTKARNRLRVVIGYYFNDMN